MTGIITCWYASVTGGGHGNPLQYSCLENPHGQRSLAGCSPWGRKESNRTEAAEHTRTLMKIVQYVGNDDQRGLYIRDSKAILMIVP